MDILFNFAVPIYAELFTLQKPMEVEAARLRWCGGFFFMMP
jgi:hypothetical protein